MKTGRPTINSSLKGSIYKSNIEIQEVLNEVVGLEIQVSEPPISEFKLKKLLEKYCLLIEYYNFINDTCKGKFYSKR